MEEQTRHPAWGSYAQRLLEPEGGLWRNPGNGGHDDKAHPPIHPTKFSSGESNWSRDHLVSMAVSLVNNLTYPNIVIILFFSIGANGFFHYVRMYMSLLSAIT